MEEDVLVRAENLSKKFCRTLKRSLWYGVKDVGGELLGWQGDRNDLRPGEFWSVNDVSFELKRGECLGLIGSNGAGKSTLLKMLNGLIKPDKGRVIMRGRIGALIELGAGFNPILTGRENVYVNGSVLGFTKKEIDRKFNEIIEFSELGEFVDMPVQNYSSGMKVRLGFAVASQMDPDVLIIDEVLAVGDTGFRIKCLNRIHELLDKAAVIFVSHSMPFVARLCTQVMVMRKGSNVLSSDVVAEGIDFYHSEFSKGKRAVTGSGEVKIKSLSINDGEDDALPVIPFGGSLHLRMDLAVSSNCPVLGARLVVWNDDQRIVIDVVDENYQTFTWKNDAESVSLAVEMPDLHLASGIHKISIIFVDFVTTRVLCRLDNAVSFIMGHHLSTASDSFYAAKFTIGDLA